MMTIDTTDMYSHLRKKLFDWNGVYHHMRNGFVLLFVLAMLVGGNNAATAAEKDYTEMLFKLGNIVTIEIDIPDATWLDMLRHASDKGYRKCTLVINGERFDEVAIRTKGASSLDDVTAMNSDRYSFTLKLDKFNKGQNYHGISKLMLNNNIWDATQMKDAIVYDMCRFIGLPAPLANYARVTLNGRYFGCYLLLEPIADDFCERNYPNEKSNIYKPYHTLAYTGDKMKNYAEIADEAKVNGGEASMKRVVAALKSVDEGKDIESHVDIESLMKYMAMQTIVVNFDYMTGHSVQNYYLREADGRISLIPWDYNLAWGGYPDSDDGSDENEAMWDEWMTSLTAEQRDSVKVAEMEQIRNSVAMIVNFPINTPFTADLNQRTFFMNLLSNEKCRKLYYVYLDTLCRHYIQGGGLKKAMSTIKQEIGAMAGTEANAFYSNDQFHKAVATLETLLQRKSESVIGQIHGTIPSTWETQSAKPQTLVPSDDIDLIELGGLMY